MCDDYSVASTYIALGLTIAAACLQGCGGQMQLLEVTRTHAMGGGCARIVIASDQQHALSVGEYGDLVRWDLKSGQPTTYVPGHDKYVPGMVLHPTQPVAAVSWSNGRSAGTVHAVDLITGETKLWLEHPASILVFDAAGERLATCQQESFRQRKASYLVEDLNVQKREPLWQGVWGPHDSPIDNDLALQPNDTVTGHRSSDPPYGSNRARSADGNTTASYKNYVITIGEAQISVADNAAGWTEHVAISNDGTVATADTFGQMHVLHAGDEKRQAIAPHRGHADRLVFSPDGTHLAIMTLGALRIVDLAGNERLTLQGTHIASPGEHGAEFWIASRAGASRWNADSQTEVGEGIQWRGQGASLIRSNYEGTRVVDRPHRIWRLSFADISTKGAWLLTTDADNITNWLVRQTHGQWRKTEMPGMEDPITVQQLAGSEEVLLHTNAPNYACGGCSMHVRHLDANGESLHQWQTGGASDWIVVNDSETTTWIASGATLFGLACNDVREVARHTSEHEWESGIAWHNDHLLVTDGKTLQVIDPMTMNRVRGLDLPKDLTELDLLAASPNRSHLAIATGTEVRILRLQ